MSVHQFNPGKAPAQISVVGGEAEPVIDADLIEVLETLLQNARNGRISAMAFITIDPSGAEGDERCTGWIETEDYQSDVLLAGIVRLEHEFEEATRT